MRVPHRAGGPRRGAPGGIAMDGARNAWVANTDIAGNKGVVELSPSGVSISGMTWVGNRGVCSTPI